MTLLRILLLLALPTLFYFAWAALMRRWIRNRGGTAPHWSDGPWMWLAAAGLIAVILGLAGTTLLQTRHAPGEYAPARLENGRIVPGTPVDPGS